MQRSTCYGQQAQTGKNEEFQDLWKEQQGTQCSLWEEIQKIYQEQGIEEDKEWSITLSRNAFSDDKNKLSVSSIAESM